MGSIARPAIKPLDLALLPSPDRPWFVTSKFVMVRWAVFVFHGIFLAFLDWWDLFAGYPLSALLFSSLNSDNFSRGYSGISASLWSTWVAPLCGERKRPKSQQVLMWKQLAGEWHCILTAGVCSVYSRHCVRSGWERVGKWREMGLFRDCLFLFMGFWTVFM
jgi:hypothetical protein